MLEWRIQKDIDVIQGPAESSTPNTDSGVQAEGEREAVEAGSGAEGRPSRELDEPFPSA